MVKIFVVRRGVRGVLPGWQSLHDGGGKVARREGFVHSNRRVILSIFDRSITPALDCIQAEQRAEQVKHVLG